MKGRTKKKKEKIIEGINEFVDEVSMREGVDNIAILQGLLNDLSLNEGENKKYPYINYPSIEGGLQRIKQILEQCLREAQQEKDNIVNSEYYQDVKRYTRNFEFLVGDRDITFAISGHKKMRNSEYSNRFERFVNMLRLSKKEGESEEDFIQLVLAGKSEIKITDPIYRKILEDRLGFIREQRRIEASKKRESRKAVLSDGR
ncbi:MAG: hypothetical protein IJB90_05545 [Clostridia bacterium]|nr:hypothetical protein [Clostridia bacterium]